ncbi:MAG: hypothetical protein M3Z23_15810, partial [Acidobacteriota bacterium]|nr:hypothetical protein [Acidobacteriota bacterium]
IMTGQGRVHFAITTSNPETQKFFDQGVAQMHSFWALEAERSFLQAAELDPSAPMPYWGIAMVAGGDYRPRHQLERDTPAKPGAKKPDRYGVLGGAGRAAAAAQKAVALSAVPGKATDLEKLYIASIAARRDPNPSDRDAAYISALRKIAAAYPNEVEAKTYLALHLMRGFTTPDRAPREGTMEAVAILRDLAIKFPDHPGVHHYIIHGFEGASFARDAWPSCRRYPELVTNIPHALHMPGHIWAQTGKWDEAAQSFESAAENELGYMKADALYGRFHHGHNVAFLIATYCFQGKYDKAVETSRGLMEFTENSREAAELDNPYTAYRQGWFGILRTLVFFEKWDEILDGKTLADYPKPREQAWLHWARGLALANKGDAGSAKAEAKRMDASLKDLAAKTKEQEPPALAVARKELDGQIASAAHKTDKSLKVLEAAGRMERALRYTEPPSYPRPVLDDLGRKALAAGKLGVAETAFRGALDQYPDDPRAVAGLSQTVRRAGKTGVAAGL